METLRRIREWRGFRPEVRFRDEIDISKQVVELPLLDVFNRGKMQNEIYQQEPNLIAEAYRNYANSDIPRRIERHFDFLDIGEDGLLLLGTSNLSGRIWSGSVWVFEDYPESPNAEKCLAGMDFESSVASGLWLNEYILIGCDSGSLHLLSIVKVENMKINYFTTEGIATKHDDSITSLALLKKNTKILSGGMDMNIKVWDVETLVPEKAYCPAHGHMVTSVSTLDSKDETFISTSLDGTTLIWDVRLEKPASLVMKNESGFTSSAWLDDNCITVGSNDGSLSLVDMRMKSEFDRVFASKRPIFKVNYNKELEFLAVCADDPFVRVFSYKERNLTNIYESDLHKDFVRGLAWEPSSKTLYSCGWDSKIFSHQVSAGEAVKKDSETKRWEKFFGKHKSIWSVQLTSKLLNCSIEALFNLMNFN